MRKVLIPYDGSPAAQRAVAEVIRFVNEYAPLEIHVLNVQPEPRVYGNFVTTSMLEQFNETALAAARQLLAEAAQMLDAVDLPYHLHAALGNVADEVVARVDALGCQLVVMGTRGMSGLANLLLGSVTTKVIHDVKVSVLLVK